MRIYDWADDVKNSWFIEDGIHFTSEGYVAGPPDRRRPGEPFPAGGGESPSCLVH